jgi:hypothetical protein
LSEGVRAPLILAAGFLTLLSVLGGCVTADGPARTETGSALPAPEESDGVAPTAQVPLAPDVPERPLPALRPPERLAVIGADLSAVRPPEAPAPEQAGPNSLSASPENTPDGVNVAILPGPEPPRPVVTPARSDASDAPDTSVPGAGRLSDASSVRDVPSLEPPEGLVVTESTGSPDGADALAGNTDQPAPADVGIRATPRAAPGMNDAPMRGSSALPPESQAPEVDRAPLPTTGASAPGFAGLVEARDLPWSTPEETPEDTPEETGVAEAGLTPFDPIPPTVPEPMVTSVTRTVGVGETFSVRLPGPGWLYLGEADGVEYRDRRAAADAVTFTFRLLADPGEESLRFEAQDLRSGRIRRHTELVVPEPSGRATSASQPPSDATSPVDSRVAGQAGPAQGGQGTDDTLSQPEGAGSTGDTADEGVAGSEALSPERDLSLAEAARLAAEGDRAAAVALIEEMRVAGLGNEDELLFRLAGILEEEWEGRDLRRSRSIYQEIVSGFPLSVYRRPSQRRIEYLDRHFFLIR